MKSELESVPGFPVIQAELKRTYKRIRSWHKELRKELGISNQDLMDLDGECDIKYGNYILRRVTRDFPGRLGLGNVVELEQANIPNNLNQVALVYQAGGFDHLQAVSFSWNTNEKIKVVDELVGLSEGKISEVRLLTLVGTLFICGMDDPRLAEGLTQSLEAYFVYENGSLINWQGKVGFEDVHLPSAQYSNGVLLMQYGGEISRFPRYLDPVPHFRNFGWHNLPTS